MTESAAKLDAPIEAKVESGLNWGETERVEQ